jgi:CDP-glucose 4,6-dehydratase
MDKKRLIEAYKDKNVYITGITGFKGGWLTLMLHELGANVSGIGLDPDQDDGIFYQARIDEIADVTIGDIVEPADTTKLIPSIIKANPDYIFHMAAQPIVSEGYKDPFNTFNTNIMGTVMLHEVIRGLRLPASKENLENGHCAKIDDENLSCKKISIINVTTDKVYKEENRPLKEDDKMFGFDPYSLSKTCSDMISSCYRDALESPHYISTMRAGNVIGGGDMAVNRIIPDIVRATKTGEIVEIRSPYSVRPYQHVFDALSAYLWVAMLQREDKKYQGEYNVGPDIDQTMQTYELVEKMQDYLDFKWKNTGKSIGKESSYLALDNTKIKSVGWVPAYSTNDLVVEAVSKWYNKSMQGEDMQKITLNQIKEAFNSYE